MRARSILQGLGFTHNMQSKVTKDFSGGWRMRVSLARALFIQPVWYVIYKTVLLLACLLYSCIISHLSHFLSLFHTHTHTHTYPSTYVCNSLLLDEPTNHLDMEAVIWLENYLSKWERILLLVSHSQDFLNNVCSHMIHLDSTKKKLEYYNGNYDTFVKTKEDDMINQLKKYKWEQEQIKSMKEYVSLYHYILLLLLLLYYTYLIVFVLYDTLCIPF
jgi:ATP-binding cassette subfamily F protein 2